MEEFARHQGLSLGLVTKSDLILRDLDLLRAISLKNRLSIHVTVTTMKTDLARLLEPRAPRPDLRLKAVKALVAAGIHTSINCAPVLPGLTDSPADLERLVRAAAEAGARSVAAIPLFLKPCSEKVFMPFLEQNFPQLVGSYKTRFAKRAFLPAEYGRRISALVKKLGRKYRLGEQSLQISATGGKRRSSDQLKLFI
jgi:DNA repair photolyase